MFLNGAWGVLQQIHHHACVTLPVSTLHFRCVWCALRPTGSSDEQPDEDEDGEYGGEGGEHPAEAAPAPVRPPPAETHAAGQRRRQRAKE